VAGGVKNCEYDYGVRSDDVKDPIRESLCKNAMNLGMRAEKHVCPRMFKRAFDSCVNLTSDL